MVNLIIEKYLSGLKIRDIAKELGISYNKTREILIKNNIKMRKRNDYGNPAKDPEFKEKLRKNRRSYKGENNPNYGKSCPEYVILATKKANTGRISHRKGKPYPESIGWVCKEPERADKLYFILLNDNNYKIGRSYKGWTYRKRQTKKLIKQWEGKSIDIWNLEKKVLKEFSKYKIELKEQSRGRGLTECFSKDLPFLDVIDFIDRHFI